MNDKSRIEIGVGEYLRYKGFDAPDVGRMNSPLRHGSDSNSFVITDSFWHDHVSGDGGNTYQLALEMHNDDPKEALKSMYDAKGLPWTEYQAKEVYFSIKEKQKSVDVLEIIKKTYPAKHGPKEVKDYLKDRMVTSKTIDYFSFVPKGELIKVISQDEIDKMGLNDLEGKIIFWYFKNGNPVYYCTRSITDKEFRKGKINDGLLTHPIWNVDDLYTKEHVVWGEGMFDCISLLETGYGVAGEITCNLIETHKPELLRALRWREKNHPEWKFTICLDNDKPDSMGIRRGNEAAKKIALWLLDNGINCHWVKWTKEEEEADVKIDINSLHQEMGMKLNNFLNRLNSAPTLMELISNPLEECINYHVKAMAHGCRKSAYLILEMALSQADAQGVMPTKTALNAMMRKTRVHWRDIYNKDIDAIILDNKKIFVFYRSGYYPDKIGDYRVFEGVSAMIENLKGNQLDPEFDPKRFDIIIPSKPLYWKVTKETPSQSDKSKVHNMFTPSPILLQEPLKDPSKAVIPSMWNVALDNLAGEHEKEWLLNHMATYVQTLRKPLTIPVFEGGQGSAKTAIIKLFGKGVGSFAAVGNSEIESSFNEYMLKAVVLFDEVSNSNFDSIKLKNKLKSLINETQTINQKYQALMTADCNNYVAMAYNPQALSNSISIEEDDRRYTIISGGHNKNLEKSDEFDYDKMEEQTAEMFLHLLSRPIDVAASKSPIKNTNKENIISASRPQHFERVKDFLELLEAESDVFGDEKVSIPFIDENRVGVIVSQLAHLYNKHYKANITAKAFREILEQDPLNTKYVVNMSGGYQRVKQCRYELESVDTSKQQIYGESDVPISISSDSKFEVDGFELFGD